MNRTVLVIGIIFLLIGASIVSSTEPSVEEDNHYNYNPIESNSMTKELLSNGKIAYGFDALNYDLVKFPLDDPGNIEIIADGDSVYFLSGGAWTCDGEWYGCEYNSGTLWSIDPETGDQIQIGGGGTSCIDMSYDPINGRLYGAANTGLYEYDPETGEQTYIGSYGTGTSIVGIAINSKGVCYAWGSILYTIDLETGKTTEVCTLNYPGGCGCFDYDTNILYMSGIDMLIESNIDTCECTLVGYFGSEITCLTIPYNCSYLPPVTTISFDPPEPDGENGWYVTNVTATLNSTDYNGVDTTYYRVNSGEWNIYSSPFIISEEGHDILIEYYSIDNLGNIENVKSTWLDIDKTSPNIIVEWDVEKVGWIKWLISFTITIIDNTSGSNIDRLEIFMNKGLQTVISGSGPTYGWSVVIYGGVPVDFKFIVYDIAGNYAVVEVTSTEISYNNRIKDIFTQQSINPLFLQLLEMFPLLQRLSFVLRDSLE